MRKLKIRAWFEPTEDYKKEWFSHYGKNMPNLFYNTYTDEDIFYDVSVDLSKFKSYPVVEQYTGLKDKNGKEIYEGDIVKHGEAILEIKFDEIKDSDFTYYYLGWIMEGGAYCDSLCEYNNVIEVIGNIHENGELLRDKE